MDFLKEAVPLDEEYIHQRVGISFLKNGQRNGELIDPDVSRLFSLEKNIARATSSGHTNYKRVCKTLRKKCLRRDYLGCLDISIFFN